MKIIDYNEKNISTELKFPDYYRHFYPDAQILFFDIETTGFAAQNTILYLIGALWYEDNEIKIRQWFNDDGTSEAGILNAFQEFCKDFTHLVHFNGSGFDIPYLKQKTYHLKLPFILENNLEQIDIYKKIRTYKNILALDNMKQVSIEQYLGINREDIYSGKELIEVYKRYIIKPETQAETLLLVHNHDDLLGMPQISTILNITAFFENIEITSVTAKQEDNRFVLNFTFHSSAALPKRISLTNNKIYLNGIDEKATLYLPIINGTLKHYFSDYKNYYYLPKEDTAIHKSVAAYVESENKQKATKDTCYIKKDDCFIPCPDSTNDSSFKTEYSDKYFYQTIESLQTGNLSIQINYIKNTLRTFL